MAELSMLKIKDSDNFHLQYKRDEFGGIYGYELTQLFLSRPYYQYWKMTQLITNAVIPFVLLILINLKIYIC